MLFSSFILKEDPVKETPSLMSQASEIKNFVSNKEILIPAIFILVFIATPACSDAMFFYFTNELGFEPEFMGRMKMVYGIGMIIGMIIYRLFLHKIDFKYLLVSTTVLCSLISLLQLLLVTGANKHIGIPNEVFAIVCTFIIQISAEINILPLLVLCCKICPKYIEGSMYALLMSTVNLGYMLSGQFGGLLMLALGITEKNFDLLWVLILISSFSMLVPLPILYFVPKFGENQKDKTYEEV